MPYKIRASKKKQAIIPIQEIKGRFDLLKERFASRPLLTGGVIATVAVILISIPAYGLFMRQSEDRAWGLQQEASRLFHEKVPAPTPEMATSTKLAETTAERLAKAAILYDDILDRYPASKAAVLAQFEAGNVYVELGNYDAAEKRYLAFLKKETDRKELLPLVHLRLAYLYEKQKKDAQALDHFKTAYEWDGGFNKDQAGFERGVLLERIGKKTEAIEILKKVSETFKDSPWGSEAKARLAMLDPTTAPAPVASMPPAIPTPTPVPVKFTPPSPPKNITIPVAQKASSPSPVVAQPTQPKGVTTPVPVPVPVPAVPAIAPTPEPKPAAPVPTPPAPDVSPSTPIPLEITPDMLRQLCSKGTLTVPLPPQPQAPIVVPVPEKKEIPPALSQPAAEEHKTE